MRLGIQNISALSLAALLALTACDNTATGIDTGTTTTGGPATTSPVSSFNITLRYVGGDATPRQQAAVAAAVARWQTVIAGDVSDITGNAPADACFPGQPAINERIDDILIYVEFAPIDGVGQVLGEAGPCYIRNEGGLPIIGHLELDQADLQQMERNGTLDAVVLHEMGHILGIGTLWPASNLLAGAGGTDPRFTGSQAVSAYRTLGGLEATVPVEDSGADGTRDGHWRETTFGNELMTGYISGSTNPMSAMTVASLRDMGYNANTSLASSYSFASSMQRITASPALVKFNGAEYMAAPKFLMHRDGSTTAIKGVTSTTPWRKK